MSATVSATGQPIFEVKVEATDVACEIRVNDVPVLRLPGGMVKTEFDVNPVVFTGKNTLTVIVRPSRGGEAFGRHAGVIVSLQRRAAKSAADAELLASLVFAGPGGDVATGFERSPGYATGAPPVVDRLGIRGTQAVELMTPFEPWSWLTAPKIVIEESARAELLAAYNRTWKLMKARDIDGLVRACAFQAKDYQAAYYLPDEASAVRMLGIPLMFADPDVEVEDFPEANWHVELLGGGRLVQLVDDEGQPLLRLRLRSVSNMTGRFVCVFCRTAGGFRVAR